ncbi:MAG: hypothetical protein AAGF11_24470 [Myxococcota bacterium]
MSVVLGGSLGIACGDPGSGSDASRGHTEGIDIDSAAPSGGGTPGVDGSGSGGGSGADRGTAVSGASGVDGTAGESAADGGGPKFDVASPDDVGGCPGDGEAYDFSTIWIANSPEGTVSKIDTRTGQEQARYITGPEADPDPSRTSVNLQGDVAVGNRGGSIVKIANRLSDCVDTDGDGTILTSTGPADVLPWGDDECVLWHTDLPFAAADHMGGPRAVAWDVGEPVAKDPMGEMDECATPSPRVWVGWRDMPNTTALLRRLDGQTGLEDAQVAIDNWQGRWGHGSYGGAVDGDNNFWALGTWSTLVRVDGVTLDVDRWENNDHNAYGIAIDADGNPWLAGFEGRLTHFDVATETFVDHGIPGPGRLRGLAIDGDGYAWIAANSSCALVQFDVAAESVVDAGIPLPGCGQPVGISIDVDGFVWVVDRDSSEAYKVDPVTYGVETFGGLVNPYTYSDMTGAGLGLVFPPEG